MKRIPTTRRRTMRRAGIVAVTIAALAAPTAAQAAETRRADPKAEVWVTTVDRAEQLTRRADVTFTKGSSDRTTLTVDPTTEYQTMDGFGASITDSSAAVLSALPDAQRTATLRSLFSDDADGIGVSFLRQPLGSSDFTAGQAHYTYDDMPAGETDFALEHFSIAHDEKQILPLLREAKRLNPELTVMGTPWSPPAWMKEDDDLNGGRLKADPRIYDAYARYLVKTVEAYAAAGVPLDYLSVQNEPQHRAPDGYPGTEMRVDQQAAVIEALGPLLKKASPSTKLLGYDHNWATSPYDLANMRPGEEGEPDYPYRLLETGAARWLDGIAFHCYAGEPSAMTAMHDAHPDKSIWFTECSGSHDAKDTPEQVFRGTLTWHARTLAVGVPRNWAKSVVTWNIALDDENGPHLGGCATCTGLVTVSDDGSVRRDAEFFTIGHLSKFVKPGAVRVASTNYGTTGWNGRLTDVAFRNPDGSTALVVHNESDDPRTFAVAVGDHHFEYELPGGALATFVWPQSRDLRRIPEAVSTTSATVTASANADTAALAVDDDGSTRWTPGSAQVPGQWIQLDLGEIRKFRRVDIDSGDEIGDYARGWKIEVSRDGKRWRTYEQGTGTGQLTTVDHHATNARYIRVSTTASSGSWWSVADIRLFL